MSDLHRRLGLVPDRVPEQKSTATGVYTKNGAGAHTNGTTHVNGTRPEKPILLNAFDMSTIGHLSPGQWKVEATSRPDKKKHGEADNSK